MKQLFVICVLVGVALSATQTYDKHPKQRKPSLPKKYIVQDGGYVKHRKIRSIVSQYELREMHRMGRQLPGVRNGGYLYNRPIYTSSDHLAARPALPLTEVESHPLSNFPAHYTGDLEDEAKDGKKDDKKPNATETAKKETKVEEAKPKKEETPKKAEVAKPQEITKEMVTSSTQQPVAVKPVPAAVEKAKAAVEKSKTASEKVKTPVEKAKSEKDKQTSEAPKKNDEKPPQVSQPETVSGKPPKAVE